MVRTNQGGSILGFIIIGAVMAILLIGGAYFVRHNLASVVGMASDTANQDDESAPEPSTEEEPAGDGNEEQNEGQEESEPAPVSQEEAAPSEPQSQEAQPESTPHGSLPQAGPADMLLGTLLISSVVGVLAAYLRSRSLPSSL